MSYIIVCVNGNFFPNNLYISFLLEDTKPTTPSRFLNQHINQPHQPRRHMPSPRAVKFIVLHYHRYPYIYDTNTSLFCNNRTFGVTEENNKKIRKTDCQKNKQSTQQNPHFPKYTSFSSHYKTIQKRGRGKKKIEKLTHTHTTTTTTSLTVQGQVKR